MPRPKRKTKAEDLARARNNQRKSRERKKHRVAELEQKVKQLESAAAAMAEVSMPSMSLVNENRILRRLLESIGYDSGSLEEYLEAPPVGQQQSSLDSNSMVPAASTPGVGFVGLELGLTPTGQLAAEEASSSFQTADLIHPATLDFSYSAPTLGAEEVSLDILQGQGPTWNAGFSITQDLAGVLHTMDGETSRSASSVNGETTLCSVAFHLIVQCNRTGKDVLEVETKLRYGYKMPAGPGEGCRVDNRTLLAVLAELVSEAEMGPIT